MEQSRKREMGKKRKDDIYVAVPGARQGGGAAVKTPWSSTERTQTRSHSTERGLYMCVLSEKMAAVPPYFPVSD